MFRLLLSTHSATQQGVAARVQIPARREHLVKVKDKTRLPLSRSHKNPINHANHAAAILLCAIKTLWLHHGLPTLAATLIPDELTRFNHQVGYTNHERSSDGPWEMIQFHNFFSVFFFQENLFTTNNESQLINLCRWRMVTSQDDRRNNRMFLKISPHSWFLKNSLILQHEIC